MQTVQFSNKMSFNIVSSCVDCKQFCGAHRAAGPSVSREEKPRIIIQPAKYSRGSILLRTSICVCHHRCLNGYAPQAPDQSIVNHPSGHQALHSVQNKANPVLIQHLHAYRKHVGRLGFATSLQTHLSVLSLSPFPPSGWTVISAPFLG